ncbi:hypothetical protein O3301_18490 [Janthinobacterium sp. SUN211]|uniref:hypothetical protein n=1 Tax=Janthinobacterium sp. SUN211 TaxID=3014786 RepID=UPI00271370D0|nr:hypothetical protein [Janthinobacterium sp. SUN211]MDO8050450.1 hypothetical protein [Janthinobacterium sp. SUN211]
MSQNFVDEIVEFFKDLILGDFEDDQGKAAMIVGGAISLIPVVDQVMDVRDVSGMIYRVGRKGVSRATRDDWVDMALAAFGCIPEVGSLFKTIIKPLRKYRKEVGAAAAGGNVMIEAMLGKSKGAAIKFLKTFQWAQNTQLAISTAMSALDNCVQLLGYLSTSHWWLPSDLQHLARDMKPQVEAVRGPLKAGIAQGAKALQDLIEDMLGEDALWAAKKIAVAAGTGANTAARHNHKPGNTHPHSANAQFKSPTISTDKKTKGVDTKAKTKERDSPGKGKEHKPVDDSHRQSSDGGTAPVKNTSRQIRELLSKVPFGPKGLIGEHMADYYHMEHVLKKATAWPHGNVNGKWRFDYPRVVGPDNAHKRPTELVPEDLKKMLQNGVDTIWQTNSDTFHFIEAKFSSSAYTLFQRLQKEVERGNIPRPPASLNDRELMLWTLLGERIKGTQMGKKWLTNSTKNGVMQSVENLKNRWTYLILGSTALSNPFVTAAHPHGKLKLAAAPGVVDHLAATLELLASGDHYNIKIHDKHKETHGISDTFNYMEIDRIDKGRRSLEKATSKKPVDQQEQQENKNKSSKAVSGKRKRRK